MISKKTGEITVENILVSPSITLDKFVGSSFGMNSQVLVKNGEWSTIQVDTGSQIGMNLLFSGQELATVTIYIKSSDSSWTSWSKVKECERMIKHDELLRHDLGQELYVFSWGKVESTFDVKSGSTSIIVTYLKSIN